MDKQRREELVNQLLGDIKQTEEFVESFKKEMTRSLYSLVAPIFPVLDEQGKLTELLDPFSLAVLNFTDSVIDKDHSYPTYRLDEELQLMRLVLSKQESLPQWDFFKEELVGMMKLIMVKYFPQITDLSGNGLRLLSVSANYYGADLVLALTNSWELKTDTEN